MSDVAAVLLSLDEPFVQRARESIAAQSLPVTDLILVNDVTPFHRALNEGARRVTTPFFVQVDADMILDPHCVETLRAAVRDDTGIVVGELRDPLVERVVGVKLFRTACVQQVAFSDSVSPDTDFGAAIARAGWKTVYVGRPAPGTGAPVATLGEHRPDYTPAYTFRKHLLEGRRYWHRGAAHGMRARNASLAASSHPLAPLAQLAMGHGLFLSIDTDGLGAPVADGRAEWLHEFLSSGRRGRQSLDDVPAIDPSARLRDTFRRFAAAGRLLRQQDKGASIVPALHALRAERHQWHALTAVIALGHGLLDEAHDGTNMVHDERLMARFLLPGVGSRTGIAALFQARAMQAVRRVRRHGGHARW
jgi:hypothetical protein